MAKYRIEAPDGKTFDIEGDGTPEQALAHFQQNYKPEPQAPAPIFPLVGGAEAAANLGTGMIGSVAGGLAGLGTAAGNALGLTDRKPGDVVRDVAGAMTYEPRTREGKAISGVVAYPFEKLAQGADWAGGKAAEATGSPAVGAAVNTAVQMAPALVGKLGGAPVRGALADSEAAAALAKSKASLRDATLNEGRDAGYVVPPDTSMFRGIAGKAAIRQEAVIRNQGITNDLAKKAVEVPEETPLTPGVLDKKRYEFSEPYREIAALADNHPLFQPPFKNASGTLEELKNARADANKWYAFADRSGHPMALKRAENFEAKADLLEHSLEETAKAIGHPDLVQAMRDARVKIAKTYDVERALNLGDGNVSAHLLGNMLDRGKPLTGELATIAKFDQAFRKYTAESSTVEAPGGGALIPHAATALGIAGHASGLGWLPAGLPLLGGPARSLLLSDLYQKPNTYGPGIGLRGASALFDERVPPGLAAIQAAKQGQK